VAKYFTTQWINDADKPDPSSDHLVTLFYEAMISEPKGNEMILYYMDYAFEKDRYYRKISLDLAARTFLKQLPGWIARYHGEYLDPVEDLHAAQFFAAIWAGEKAGKDDEGKTTWFMGPSSDDVFPILRQALVDNPERNKRLYIEYAFEKAPGLRTASLEEAAKAFMEELPEWIAKYNKESSDLQDEEEEDDSAIWCNEEEGG
jgi:hypothetical protein